MEKYSEHFLLDQEEAKKYAVDVVHYFEGTESLNCQEIGDGNINYVFQVQDLKTGKSLILKQADIHLRSSGRLLDLDHNRIEARILQLEGQLTPDFVPRVYHYDPVMCVIAMEDVSQFKNMRKELSHHHIFRDFADQITDFFVQSLLPTTDLVMDRHDKKRQAALFINPDLCEITEDLVLSEPYNNWRNRNIIFPGNEGFVEETLYHDEALHREAAKLRYEFMNHAQALLHGDLHTGSIFINDTGLKVLDPEFAFYGPMGYDIGNVIGNLFFALTNAVFTDPDEAFECWISSAIEQTIDMTKEKLELAYGRDVSFDLYREPGFRQFWLHGVLADALGYTGTEMIRRVVGDSKVSEVERVTNPVQRIPLERTLITMGVNLIKKRNEYSEGAQVMRDFDRVVKLIKAQEC